MADEGAGQTSGLLSKIPAPRCWGALYRLDVPPGTDIEALLERLPLPAEEDRVVLVNGRTAHPGQVLEEGDTLAVFPAMARG